MDWISVNKELPDYGIKVLLHRKCGDMRTGFFHKVSENGQTHGYMGCKRTFEDYWSVPAIITFDTVTHWLHLMPPNSGDVEPSKQSTTSKVENG